MLTTEFFIYCRIITIKQIKVTELFKKAFLYVAIQIHVSYVCILPNAELKNLISKTEAAPKEHHDRGMIGWEGRLVSKVEVRTQALTMFICFQLSSAEILDGIGPNTLAYTFIYTHI